MKFDTYTLDGLNIKLNKLLTSDIVNERIVNEIYEINTEITLRGNNTNIMSTNEQVYWILKDFDFEKVHTTMVNLNWTWFGCNGVPTINDLVIAARDRLFNVINAEQSENIRYYESSGGLYAERNIYDGIMCLSLKFVLADWDMEYDSIIRPNNYSNCEYNSNWTIEDILNENEEECD